MFKGNSLIRLGSVGLVLGLAVAVAVPAQGAGFAIFEAGSRATGLGGALVAPADDLSAMFYNPAGLGGMVEKGKLKTMVGVTLIFPDSKLTQGLNPYPGTDYSTKQKSMIFFPPNFYAAYGLSECVSLSLGSWFPYGLSTAWDDPDNFRGKYLSQRVDLRQYALGLQVAWQINEYISVGAGPEFRISDVKLYNDVPKLNPYTNRIATIAHADIVGDGFGSSVTFGAGIKINPTPALSLGASYHGKVDTSYTGVGTFYSRPTGYKDFDAAVAAALPLDKPVPVETSLVFPALWQMGVSYKFNKSVMLSLAANYTEWSALKSLVLAFSPVDNKKVPDSVTHFDYEDAWAYRIGLSVKTSEKLELLAGFVYDQTPQPDSAVSPLLPDANRSGYSIGFSAKIGKHSYLDFSNLFLFFHERTTTTNDANFNATYKTFADLAVLNFRTSF